MEAIPDRAVGITSPDFPESFCIINDDGSIDIRAGEASILIHPDGEIIIHCSRLKYVCDSIEWNDVAFNDRATNPAEPALTIPIKKLLPSDRSIKDYGN
jgi:hypothetical protein